MFKLSRASLFFLTVGLLGSQTLAHAAAEQEEDPDEVRDTRWTFSAGARVMPINTKVRFGNLGITRSINSPTGNASTTPQTYDNGKIFPDVLRPAETSNGVQTSTGPTYTVTNSTGNQVEHISYNPNQTRIYTYNKATQEDTSAKTIGLSTYRTESLGGTAHASSSGLGGGIEMSLQYRVGRLSRNRVEWGLGASMGMSRFEAAAQGRVTSRLLTTTDNFKFNGDLPADRTYRYAAPTYADFTAPGTTTVTPRAGPETTAPLNVQRSSQTIDSAGTAIVSGKWEVSGADFQLRFGPFARITLSESWALSFGFGGVANFVSAQFSESETLEKDDLSNATVTSSDSSTELSASYGVFAKADLEYWVNDDAGFYLGVSYENLDSNFGMTLSSRTAGVELNASSAVQSGIIVRF